MKLLRVRPSTGQLVFILFLFAGSYFYYPVDYDNSSSRLFFVSSIVDFGSFHIDPYADLTADKSWFGSHYYSNKAIGAPLLAAPFYWVHRQAQPWPGHPPLTRAMRYVIRLFTTTLPFAFLGACLFGVAKSWSGSERRSLIVAFVYGFGSIALIHAGMFSGHGMAAAFGFFAFAGWLRMKEKCSAAKHGAPGGNGASLTVVALASGLSAGFAALCDYTAILVALTISIYGLFTPVSTRLKILFYCAGLFCAGILAIYNWMSFGSPFSFSYAHQVTSLFSEPSAKGLWGITWPKPSALGALLFSPSRGLLAVMPVFAFSLVGLWNMLRSRLHRPEALLILFVSAVYLLSIAGFYGWHGGWSYGPRYLVPMLPFLALAIIFSHRASLLFGIAAGVSVVQVNLVAMSQPNVPELIRNPIKEMIVPFIREGHLAESWPGWLGLPEGRSVLLYLFVCVLLFLLAWGAAAERDRRPEVNENSPGGGGSPIRPLPSRLQTAVSLCMALWIGAIGLMIYGIETRPSVLVSEYRERLLFHLRNRERIQNLVSIAADNYRKFTAEGKKDSSSTPLHPRGL